MIEPTETPDTTTATPEPAGSDHLVDAVDAASADAPADTPTDAKPAKKKTKRRSRKKTSKTATADDATSPEPSGDAETPDTGADATTDNTSPAEGADAPTSDDKPKKKRSRKKTSKKTASKPAPAASKKSDDDEGPTDDAPPAEMLVNYVPGEECRIAIVEDGQLEEFYSEPTNAVSRVGNIYVGRVTNVESAIQAAFVDFGVEENGFLHISDLHPQYFPGEDDETTERVGKKTPRRSRPPIQQALRRGQEIIVQVLKEGVGTKGPTLTSYLSIPGRFLVMMPQMDKVGVSRKEEDDDKRRQAKAILDQLELPEGFGFILRTAGLDRTKTELKRDLAYLSRLWKDMEKRREGGKAPRLLYSESDLLVRSLRDLLTNNVTRVVIDSEAALNRAARFMKIVAPRSGAKLTHFQGKRPIFHAFNVEEQIRQIHAREVMLPSGGRLVIDQTEALVAIDVNSGKSRRAGDAETNAYQTNVEAVDAICRQLRLRDLGGLVISDLIDMRHASHRKDIENRFRERLKRDRARSTTLPISQFGILEMTRQRMRGSQESMHFADCPTCHGRGLVQRPDSVAADAMRELADLLDHDKVFRVELVVHPRVAGALLSTRRQTLTRVELTMGKHVDVRISDSIPLDRVTFYAYEESGADIDITRLPKKKDKPPLVDWEAAIDAGDGWAVDLKAEADEVAAHGIAELAASVAEHDQRDSMQDVDVPDDEDDDSPEGTGKKKRRRRRRRGRRSDEGEGERPGEPRPERDAESSGDDSPTDEDADHEPGSSSDEDQPKKKRRRRRRRRGRRSGEGEGDGAPAEGHADHEGAADADEEDDDDAPDEPAGSSDDASADSGDHPRKKRRRRRRGKSGDHADARPADGAPAASTPAPPAPAKEEAAPKPRRRGLYSAGRRRLSASETQRLSPED